MKRIHQVSANILYYGAQHLTGDYFFSFETIERTIADDLLNSGITKEQFVNNLLILDFRAEGQDHNVIKPLIDYFRQINKNNFAVVFNSIVDTSKLDYPAYVFPAACADVCGWFTNLKQFPMQWDTDCDFLCLMRRPSFARAKLAARLLNEKLSLRISFGVMCDYSSELEPFRHYFENINLPLLVDGYCSRNQPGNKEHDVTSDLLRCCAINIIAESSSQNKEDRSWRSTIISEKTFKAFGLLQIPIWWAVPGLVSEVRKLGFDVFDDLVDHSYDDLVDEDLRLEAVIEQIINLKNKEPQSFRTIYRSRLLNNWNHLNNLIEEGKHDFDKIISTLSSSS